jgi:hypothetical protein
VFARQAAAQMMEVRKGIASFQELESDKGTWSRTGKKPLAYARETPSAYVGREPLESGRAR